MCESYKIGFSTSHFPMENDRQSPLWIGESSFQLSDWILQTAVTADCFLKILQLRTVLVQLLHQLAQTQILTAF